MVNLNVVGQQFFHIVGTDALVLTESYYACFFWEELEMKINRLCSLVTRQVCSFNTLCF